MKTENKIHITGRINVATKPRNHPRTDAKAVAVSAWAPQPNPLSREEIRRMVMEQLG